MQKNDNDLSETGVNQSPMPIEKEWAAVQQDEILLKRDTRDAAKKAARMEGLRPEHYEIVALPKAHGSVFL